MKKFLILLAVVAFSASAIAEETTPDYPVIKNRFVTNSFWDNWSLDLGVDYMSNYSNQANSYGLNGNPFSQFRTNWGINLSATKWATPCYGMRLRTQFAWAKQINSENNDLNPIYNQLVIGLQPMINLHNLIGGYKPRVWNAIINFGLGYQYNFDAHMNSPVCQFGWLNTIALADRWHMNLELWAQFGDMDMDGIIEPVVPFDMSGSEGKPVDKTMVNGFKSRDWQIGLTLGFGYDFGKNNWDGAPDVEAINAMNKAQLDALNATLADQEAENARLKSLLAQKPKEVVKTVTEFAATPVCVFFNINKSKIATRKDLVDVKALVEYAKANGKKIIVIGSADSKTGSPTYNQSLSEARANTVANEIVKMGFDRNNIEIAAKGGVLDIDPFDYNRRVVVMIK